MVKITPANTIGSFGDAWYTMYDNTFVARSPSTSPATEPTESSTKARPSAVRNTCFRPRQRHANPKFAQPFAHGIRGHAEDPRHRQHRAQQPQHAERHRRYPCGKHR